MKAVIMAGGQGTRMRPLTCDSPKPMARICGKPIIEYIMDLLIDNGVDEAAVTIKYLPQVIKDNFPNGMYKSLKLTFVEEGISLKTAGSVKNAAKDFNEPFFVISGDAMCDFNLKEIMQIHMQRKALATIVLNKVSDPREYGLVETDSNGIVDKFVEKPGWGQVTTDNANTGIYILNPEVLDDIPENEPYDFAKDLFPKMLSQGKSIYGYTASGYWCDIGDLQAYLNCNFDVIDKKVSCKINEISEGIYSNQETLPKGHYTIIPPIYIGENVEIEDGAIIGPNSVIDDGCLIGSNANIRYSLMLKNAYASSASSMTKAILGCSSSLKKNAVMHDLTATGTGVIIGKNSIIRPKVLIWPEIVISDDSTAYKNIKFGRFSRDIFDDDGITGENGVELTPETCARLGQALGSTHAGRKIGIGFDGTLDSKILKLALISGMASAGSYIWDFGECYESQMSFFTSFCGLGMGIFISVGDGASIKVCGEGGLSLPRFLEREIEARLAKGEFKRCRGELCRDVADMTSMQMIYQQELCRQAHYGLAGQRAGINCPNKLISSALRESLDRIGCACSSRFILNINNEGTRLSITDEISGTVSYEKLLAICCINEFRNGSDIALPYDAPQFINLVANKYGRKVLRYLSSPTDTADSEARSLGIKQAFLRDALFMSFKVLSIMKERNMTLSQLLKEVPDYYVQKKVFEINISPTKLSQYLGLDKSEITTGKEGITLKRDNGSLLITPTKKGDKLRVLAEASNMEIANELCAEIERKVKFNVNDNEGKAT